MTLQKLGIEYRGDKKIDACKPEDGFVVATTNNGNPHALFGNEGGYQSVGASIASNIVNPDIFRRIIQNFSNTSRNFIIDKSRLAGLEISQSQSANVSIVPSVPSVPSVPLVPPASLNSIESRIERSPNSTIRVSSSEDSTFSLSKCSGCSQS